MNSWTEHSFPIIKFYFRNSTPGVLTASCMAVQATNFNSLNCWNYIVLLSTRKIIIMHFCNHVVSVLPPLESKKMYFSIFPVLELYPWRNYNVFLILRKEIFNNPQLRIWSSFHKTKQKNWGQSEIVWPSEMVVYSLFTWRNLSAASLLQAKN